MKFKHSVIGVNTAENREWLEKIGYKKHPDYNSKHKYIVAYTADEVQEPYYDTSYDLYWNTLPADIDCIGNDNLFRAVSAIRDDKIESDQYYVLDKDKGHVRGGVFVIDYPKGSIIKNPLSLFTSFEGHKATLEELKIHFAKKIYEPKCVCATCGSRYSNGDTAFCENGHDDWLEPQDSIDIFLRASKNIGVSVEELQGYFKK